MNHFIIWTNLIPLVETPKNYEHPIKGNKEYEIFQNPNAFESANLLRTSIHNVMIKFINYNVGDCINFLLKQILEC